MLTFDQIKTECDRIKFQDWTLYVGEKNGVPYLQWQFMAVDNDNPTAAPELQKCRKWMLSYHMTHQEIERTAFLAAQQAVFHEMCEQYTYLGQQIRNPHIDPLALAALMHDHNPTVMRENQST